MRISANIPASLRRYCEAHSHQIRDVAAGDGYSTDSGFAYDVLLEQGWCCDDIGLHTIIEPTIKETITKLRSAEKCECSDCVTGEGWN